MAHELDTNILLRFGRGSDAQHQMVDRAIERLNRRGERLCYTSQNLIEFWNAATRPIATGNGFGLTIAQADQAAQVIENTFFLLPDDERVLTEWRRLVVTYGVAGKQVHDARLVAFMLV